MDKDQELVDALGEPAARTLRARSHQHRIDLKLLRPFTDGQSPARVALVLEQVEDACPQKIVAKVCPPEGDDDNLYEPGRHMAAWRRSKYDFASKHLVKLVHDPIPVDNGHWILFQDYYGGDVVPLSSLLHSVKEVREPQVPRCNAREFAAACSTVVRSMLEDWLPITGHNLKTPQADVVTFLGWLLKRRLAPGGSVHNWAAAQAPALLDGSQHWTTPAGDTVLNPVAFATDPSRTNGRPMWALCGLMHGDLHPGNILIPTTHAYGVPGRRPLPADYRLIDLSRFDGNAPLTYDPAHLGVSIVAGHLDGMKPNARAAAINFLVDPTDDHSGDLLPVWLRSVVVAISDVMPSWRSHFTSEWREQTLLSLLACGLVFTGRSTTADRYRPWFFELAARAGEAYLQLADHPAPQAPKPHEPAPSIEAGRAPAVSRVRQDTGDEVLAADGGHAAEAVPTEPTLPPEREQGRRRVTKADQKALDRACDWLADKVHGQWFKAAEGRRLLRPTPVRVRWEKARFPVVGPLSDAVVERAPPGVEPTDIHRRIATQGDVSTLFQVYCDLGSSRLVILGQAGSGKTAAAIKLVLDVLAYRSEQDSSRRSEIAVPVILTPHDWNPQVQSLTDWLVQRLAADYPKLRRGRRRSHDLIVKLLDARRLVLVLEGLDDMHADDRALALEQIDTAVGIRIVVVSRSVEMVSAAAHWHLTSAAAVELQPVQPEEAADYLVRCQTDPLPDGWKAVIDAVRTQPDGAVAQALDSPLMLGLLRDNYARDDPVEELLDSTRFPTRGEVEDHLLGQLLPGAYRPSPGERAYYTLTQAQRWLGHLAVRMHQDNTRDLAWWDLPRWVPRWRSYLLLAIAASILPTALFAWLASTNGRTLLWLAASPVLGLAATLFDALVVNITHPDRGRPAFRIGVSYVIGNMLAGALCGGFLGDSTDAAVGLGTGLAVGLGLGVPLLVLVVVRRFGVNSRPAGKPNSPLDPAACWRRDWLVAGAFGLVLGITMGVTIGLVCRLGGQPVGWAAFATAVGLVVVTVTSEALVLSISAKTSQATLQLFCCGQGPLRLFRFLEDARARNVLRTAGSVYQFRHAQLQDLLARLYLEDNPDAGEGPPPRRRV